MFALNLFDTQAGSAPGADPNRTVATYARSPAHDALARDLAQASITLLKNDGLLPVAPANIKKVAVFGDENTAAGGGSGHVEAPYTITPAQGITAFLNGALPPPPVGVCTFESNIVRGRAVAPLPHSRRHAHRRPLPPPNRTTTRRTRRP